MEAIAECQGIRSPNANTAIKLAAFYTILDHLEDGEKTSERSFSNGYSFADDAFTVQYAGNSEFAKAISGKRQSEVWPIIDELMETIKAMNERLYSAVIKKLK